MEKTSHWNISFTGDKVDDINLFNMLEEFIEDNDLKIEITSVHNSTHYTQSKK